MSALPSSPWSVRPRPEEHNAFYQGYLNAVPDGDLMPFLADQLYCVQRIIGQVTAEKADYRYEEGKWTVRQVFGHMVDTEWIFGGRLLWISRGDPTPLPGMDQTVFVRGGHFEDRGLDSMLAEFSGLRTAVMTLMDSLRPEAIERMGTASGWPISARALGWILAGHCEHHLNVLKERYGIETA